jgi:N6-adenosine-specific RNA methylase IME4
MGLPARLAPELVKASPDALPLGEGLPLDRWVELGKQLCMMGHGVQWWIGDWWVFGDAAYGERAQAAASGIFGRAFQTLMNAGSVARSFAKTSRRQEVLSFSHHAVVTSLDPDVADALLDEAEDYDLTVRELRDRVHEVRHHDRSAEIERISLLSAVPLPIGRRFPVIYADPPWRYENSDPLRAAENHYPTMPLDKICALQLGEGLPVKAVAADTAVLYLWATPRMLPQALEVVEAWGFVYLIDMVWVKDRVGIGRHTLGQHEHLLIATRGNFPAPLNGTQSSSVIDAPRRAHSQKPEEAYEIIERLYPKMGKIELFARGPARPGWTVWGNQAKQSAA